MHMFTYLFYLPISQSDARWLSAINKNMKNKSKKQKFPTKHETNHITNFLTEPHIRLMFVGRARYSQTSGM